MPWYHHIATFLNDVLPQFRTTRHIIDHCLVPWLRLWRRECQLRSTPSLQSAAKSIGPPPRRYASSGWTFRIR